MSAATELMDREASPRPLPSPLFGIALVSIGIGLLLVGGLAVDRWPFGFDRAIIVGLRQWGGPAWLPHAAADVTALGGGTVLTMVVIAAAGFLIVERHWLAALSVVLASASGGWAVDLVKTHVGRARPDLVPHLVPVSSMSFPSGHAASSAVVYITIAALAAQVTAHRETRRYVIALAVLLVGAIGCSRVYLGVHWPSDVLAGWSFGTLWALGWWYATGWTRASLRQR